MCIQKNSEILFVYDAKLTNPNGDMDNENKPRMDYDTDTNLVSDVRLKRYIRDYYETVLGKEIFITDKAEDAKDRGKQLKNEDLDYTDLIDVRNFGAVYASSGANTHLTGPIQFNWGYSLNPVEINQSSTITSSFSKGEGIGKDFRVNYSILAFSGGINALVAEGTKFTEEDLNLFDEAIIKSIMFARTRSKIGQTPRFYIRVEAPDKKTFLKDLREYLSIDYKIENEYAVRDINDYALNIIELKNYLKNQNISKIYYWKDDKINLEGWDEFKSEFSDKVEKLEV